MLLISIDAFHADDLAKCTISWLCPNLERLTDECATYTNISTTNPWGSFRGMMTQMMRGTPTSNGVFYDNSYDRTFSRPAAIVRERRAPI